MPVKDIGAYLKESREALGLTIHEVMEATKIRPRLIKALEENDFESLPQGIYRHNHIRTYATFLRLDVDDITEQLPEEKNSNEFALPEPYRAEFKPTNKIIILSISLFLLGYGIWYYSNKSEIPISEPINKPITEETKTEEKKETTIDYKPIEAKANMAGIVILAKERVRIQLYSSDYKLLSDQHLNTGQTLFVPEQNGLILMASNLKSVDMFLNGSPFDMNKILVSENTLVIDQSKMNGFIEEEGD